MTDKPRGHYEKFLVIDTETSGMSFGGDPSIDYQIVSIGLIVSDFTFKPLEELYVELQWNGIDKWNDKAESVHGLSKAYLSEHGSSERDAVEKIAGMMVEHFEIERPITLLGHNVGTFDLPFFRKLLLKYDLPFKFSHRTMDTFSLAIGTIGTFNSDDLFDVMGFEKRKSHNALDDARYALKTFGTISKLWNKFVG
jgi:DNA polymerase III epsilon subunit-like protein